MKFASITLGILSSGFLLTGLTGCQTGQVGATNTLGAYSTMIDSTPDKVTVAAQKADADLKLLDIVGNGTAIDGHVSAKNAQGDDVTIDIAQAGDNVSKVTIRVGATGDDAVSKQLVDRIKDHLTWL
jgi:hypothetical protein